MIAHHSNRNSPISMRFFTAIRPFFMILTLATLAACSGDAKREAKTESLPVDELYLYAKDKLNGGNYDDSVRIYKRLLGRFPFGDFTEQAQIDMAYAQFKSYEPEDAVSTLNRFIKTYPTHKHIDYAYYLRGLTNFDRDTGLFAKYFGREKAKRDNGFARLAINDFRELIDRYPSSRYAPDARQRMVYLRNQIAQAELNIAEYYFRRKAYVASANRAKYILENFQQTPQSGDALALMVESYQRLGEEKLSSDARKVLELNFPSHQYFAGKYPVKPPLWRQLIPFMGS